MGCEGASGRPLITLSVFASRFPVGAVLWLQAAGLGKIITSAHILITYHTQMVKKALVMFYGMLL